MPASSGGPWLWLPCPSTFLGFLHLQTGTELITLALALNKATGIYGLLSLLTGYEASTLQVSLHISSVLVVALLCLLVPHIRKQSPFENLALAWLYVIDAVINIAYTASFASTWYLASFHDPKGTAGASSGSDAIVARTGLDAGQAAQAVADFGGRETATSMCLIIAFMLVRTYCSLVVMAHARMVLHVYVKKHAGWSGFEDCESHGRLANPFAHGSPLGEDWSCKVGRLMVYIGQGYWLGQAEDEKWAEGLGPDLGISRPLTYR